MEHSHPSLPVIMTTFEQQYRQYLSIFNGEIQSEEAVYYAKDQFSTIYHAKVQSTEFGGYPINRFQIKHLHELYLALGSKMTLLHFRRESSETVDAMYQVENKQENTIFHNMLTLKDNKIIRVQTKEDYYQEMLEWLIESNIMEMA